MMLRRYRLFFFSVLFCVSNSFVSLVVFCHEQQVVDFETGALLSRSTTCCSVARKGEHGEGGEHAIHAVPVCAGQAC